MIYHYTPNALGCKQNGVPVFGEGLVHTRRRCSMRRAERPRFFFVSKADMEENAYESSIFIHSDEDYRCPLEQGLQMYTALAVQGVPTRLCLFHGENHELSRSGKPKHRVRRLTEITKWFERFAKTE